MHSPKTVDVIFTLCRHFRMWSCHTTTINFSILHERNKNVVELKLESLVNIKNTVRKEKVDTTPPFKSLTVKQSILFILYQYHIHQDIQ